MSLEKEHDSQTAPNVAINVMAMRSNLKRTHQESNRNKQMTIEMRPNKKRKLNENLVHHKINDHNHHAIPQKTDDSNPCIQHKDDSVYCGDPEEKWGCSKCTFLNLSIMGYCEICDTPKSESNLCVNSGGVVDLTQFAAKPIITNSKHPPAHSPMPVIRDGDSAYLQQQMNQYVKYLVFCYFVI